MFKKAQAAMEFLMTYGWAILVVLVAIGALAYFGVLSPDNFLPKKCTVSPGIACTDHKVTAGSVIVVLRNGMGSDLYNVAVSIPECTNGTATPSGDNTLTNGEEETFTLTGCSNTGSKFSGTLNVTYNAGSSSGLQHSELGSIVTKIES